MLRCTVQSGALSGIVRDLPWSSQFMVGGGARSCGIGSAFALLYLRLLAKGVDSVAGQGGGPSAPSLLVPVILVLAYRRWNMDYAEEFGVELSLLPMLLGFFSYKLSTILEARLACNCHPSEALAQAAIPGEVLPSAIPVVRLLRLLIPGEACLGCHLGEAAV
ncbi:hypothetical protein CYMTET_32317 [Cymbomonas tetramitiformis]|uniref:CGL160/ATPI domain-containing protein n=1 Tax=Cymbomonas tetramitiformis TaxID=36881 RepID=A0AAE0KRY9_9CHLO|nr:hypothetical protein CYMTET_32317 [Cymbomonas tetramitiformis]